MSTFIYTPYTRSSNIGSTLTNINSSFTGLLGALQGSLSFASGRRVTGCLVTTSGAFPGLSVASGNATTSDGSYHTLTVTGLSVPTTGSAVRFIYIDSTGVITHGSSLPGTAIPLATITNNAGGTAFASVVDTRPIVVDDLATMSRTSSVSGPIMSLFQTGSGNVLEMTSGGTLGFTFGNGIQKILNGRQMQFFSDAGSTQTASIASTTGAASFKATTITTLDSASTPVAGGGWVAQIANNSTDSASAERTALRLVTTGLSNVNDFLLVGYQSVTKVFSVARDGSVVASGALTVTGNGSMAGLTATGNVVLGTNSSNSHAIHGAFVQDGGSVGHQGGNAFNIYSDAGTTLKFKVDGATGDTTIASGKILTAASGGLSIMNGSNSQILTAGSLYAGTVYATVQALAVGGGGIGAIIDAGGKVVIKHGVAIASLTNAYTMSIQNSSAANIFGFGKDGSFEITYQSAGSASFIKMAASPSGVPLAIKDSGNVSVFSVGTDGGVTTAAASTNSLGATTLKSVTTTADQSAKLVIGRFSVGNPSAFIKPDATATAGFTFQNAAGTTSIFKISDVGDVTVLGAIVAGSGVTTITNAAGNLLASTLTGTNALPDAVLSTNVPLINAANTFTNAVNTFGSAGATQVLITSVGNRSRLTLARSSTSIQSWSVDTGVSTDLRFYDETGTTARMSLATTGLLTVSAGATLTTGDLTATTGNVVLSAAGAWVGRSSGTGLVTNVNLANIKSTGDIYLDLDSDNNDAGTATFKIRTNSSATTLLNMVETGVTTLTTTDTANTALLINAPTSMAAKLVDLQVNAVSKFSVDAGGTALGFSLQLSRSGGTTTTPDIYSTGTNLVLAGTSTGTGTVKIPAALAISGATTFSGTVAFNANSIADAALSTNVALLNGTTAFSANQTFSGGTTTLSNGTSNIINFSTAGVAAPTFTTRSAGAKLVLNAALSGSAVDYGFGIESSALWSAVGTTGGSFKWYGGTTLAATLTGLGALTLVSTLTATGITGSSFTVPTANTGNVFTIVSNSAETGATVKMRVVKADGTSNAFTVASNGDVSVAGNLTVVGTQTNSGTLNITGDYSVSGNLSIGGNSTLGDDASVDNTTIFGKTTIRTHASQTGNSFELRNAANSSNLVAIDLSGNLTATLVNGIAGLASATPQALGTAAVGTSTNAAREDHVHTNTGLALTGATNTFTIPSIATTAETLATWKVSDDAVSLISIANGSATDGIFRPLIKSITSGANAGLYFESQITTDTGAADAMIFNVRTVAGAALATRPAFTWANNSTAMMQLAATGAITHTVTAATGVAEQLATWKVSDDASGKLEFYNESPTDANFRALIKGTATGTQAGLVFNGVSTTDTGTTGIIQLRSNISAGAAATRPLVEMMNNATTVWTVSPIGMVTQNITAVASTAETLHVWKVSDDSTGKLEVANFSGTDADFFPVVRFTRGGTGTGGVIVAQGVTDTGVAPLLKVQIQTNIGTAITTRPLVDFTNVSTSMMSLWPINSGANAALLFNTSGTAAPSFTTRSAGTRLVLYPLVDATHADYAMGMETGGIWFSLSQSASNMQYRWYGGQTEVAKMDGLGTWTHTVQSTAATAETLCTWKMSDDASSMLVLENASATDAVFQPRLKGVNGGTGTSLFLLGQGTTDTGSSALMMFDARIGAATAVTTRPLYEWRNNGTAMLQLLPLTSATSTLLWSSTATAAPAFTTRSNGTRLVLYSAVDASHVDYAVGMESNGMWFSVGNSATTTQFRWYAGTTALMTLRGDGLLDNTGTIRATGVTNPASGSGLELAYTGAAGYVTSYNRTGAAYTALHLDGLSVDIRPSGTAVITATSSAVTIAQPTAITGNSSVTGTLAVSSTVSASNLKYTLVTITAGATSTTWTHSYGSTNYAVAFGPSGTATHVAFANKTINAIDVTIDAPLSSNLDVMVIFLGS